MKINIVFEDAQMLVALKPSGLAVEEDRYGHETLTSLLKNQIYKKHQPLKECFLQNVHRLDRPVRGLVLFAKKPSSLKLLMEQFRLRKVEKYYHAVTDKAPANPHGTFTHYLFKDLKNKKALILDQPTEGYDKVVLKYRTQKTKTGSCLWDIELITGKYHQIRAQLSHVTCPIQGDVLYGANPMKDDKIELEAYRLKFSHPLTGEVVDIDLDKIRLNMDTD